MSYCWQIVMNFYPDFTDSLIPADSCSPDGSSILCGYDVILNFTRLDLFLMVPARHILCMGKITGFSSFIRSECYFHLLVFTYLQRHLTKTWTVFGRHLRWSAKKSSGNSRCLSIVFFFLFWFSFAALYEKKQTISRGGMWEMGFLRGMLFCG